jgi:2-C-methyl-D-erythritol 2,4-cyclodiphosphate synthase
MRVGFGYDIHRLVAGRKLMLGGVDIPSVKGLLGHSDADVVVHALCDALLGSVGLGDIGEHFPDTDGQYKDIASSELLGKVASLLERQTYLILNVDVTVILEEPRLSPFKQKMRQTIATVLGVMPEQVNIKAKTNEGIGLIGDNKAIAAFAVVTVNKRS